MKLTFIDGEENYQVIENIEARENSIFKDQYVVADKVFNDLMKKDNSRKYCNVLAFCGERGSFSRTITNYQIVSIYCNIVVCAKC